MTDRMHPRALARKHLDRKLTPLRAMEWARPGHGWVRAIRDALGISSRQLANRMGVSQSTLSGLERSEAHDTITLASLRNVAEALNCTLVYALVPKVSLDETMRARARLIAEERLARVHHTMRLENQAVLPEALAAERERLVDEILRNEPRGLWDKS